MRHAPFTEVTRERSRENSVEYLGAIHAMGRNPPLGISADSKGARYALLRGCYRNSESVTLHFTWQMHSRNNCNLQLHILYIFAPCRMYYDFFNEYITCLPCGMNQVSFEARGKPPCNMNKKHIFFVTRGKRSCCVVQISFPLKHWGTFTPPGQSKIFHVTLEKHSCHVDQITFPL